MRPNFGILWEGDWPFPPGDGVGIELRGRPQNGAEEFILDLACHGCHPVLGREIFDALAQGLEPRHTLRANLDFVRMNTDVLKHGVTLRILRPWPYPQGWEPRDYGPWPEDTMRAVMERRNRRPA